MPAMAPEIRDFRAVVGEQARDRCMDETIRAILVPALRGNPWDRTRPPAQSMRVQGNSKYVALRSVSTDPMISRLRLPALQPRMSWGGPGTPSDITPRVTLMANKIEQIQGGLAPALAAEELQHFHRFNKSVSSMQLRRDLAKGPTVQMQHIMAKKSAPSAEAKQAQARDHVALAVAALKDLKKKPRDSASRESSDGSGSSSAGLSASISLLAGVCASNDWMIFCWQVG